MLTGGCACRRSLRIDYADKMGNDKDKQPGGGGGGDDGGARGRGGGGQRGTQSSINSIEIVNGVRPGLIFFPLASVALTTLTGPACCGYRAIYLRDVVRGGDQDMWETPVMPDT